MLTIVLTGEPLAIGAILIVMIFAGGHISGGHYNPAVTLAVLMRGRITIGDAISYMGSQWAGALVAVLLAGWLLGNPEVTVINLDETRIQALVAEILGTFALAYVVLNVVATAKAKSGKTVFMDWQSALQFSPVQQGLENFWWRIQSCGSSWRISNESFCLE